MAVTLTNEMINGALLTQAKYGVPASVTLGQIMLESGGSYPGGLSGLAYEHNNLFGVKAGGSWTGKTATYKTLEYDSNNKSYTTNASFRKYDTVSQSIDDHGKLLSSTTYTSKTAGATNLDEYVRRLGSVYATSPTYADSLLKIIETNNLTQYDNGAFPHAFSADNTSLWGFDTDKLLSNIVIFITVLALVILAVVFFMQAFDVRLPSKNKIVSEVVNGG